MFVENQWSKAKALSFLLCCCEGQGTDWAGLPPSQLTGHRVGSLILSCGMAQQACQACSPDGSSRCMPRSVSAKLSWPWSGSREESRAVRWRSQCMTNLCDRTHAAASSGSQDSVGAVILKMQVKEVKAEGSTFMSCWPLCSFLPSRKRWLHYWLSKCCAFSEQHNTKFPWPRGN